MGLTLQTYPDAADAAAALAADASLRCLGGGTLLVRAINEGDVGIGGFVRRTSGTEGVRIEQGIVELDAGLTMSGIVVHPELGWLANAARSIGGPAIRNMATIGGNLFAPSPYGDLTVALLALDATLTLHTHGGRHEVPLHDFLPERDDRWSRSVVTCVRFTMPEKPTDFRFLKVGRIKPKGTSVLSIAALFSEPDGRIRRARVAYGAMAHHPIRAGGVEAALEGQLRTPEGIAAALAVAAEGTTPSDDAIASAWYRRQVLPVHLGRLLLA